MWPSLAPLATVIVLKAPLLLAPDPQAPVSHFVKKGEEVTLRLRNVALPPGNLIIPEDSQGNLYYETTDPLGRSVYIAKEHVKVIYEDFREEGHLPSGPDPTDYRSIEPVGDFYPFVEESPYQYLVTYAVGPALAGRYPYPQGAPLQSVEAPRAGLGVGYLRPLDKSTLKRFFYGIYAHFDGAQKIYALPGNRESQQLTGQMGVGPWLFYDFFLRPKVSFSFAGGGAIHYNRAFVKQNSLEQSEERSFHGVSFSSQISTFFHWKKAISPRVGIVLGAHIQFNLPYSLTSSSPVEIPHFWNLQNDTLSFPAGGSYMATLGIRVSSQ